MEIDNSAAELFQFCPAAYEERYLNKITSNKPKPGLEFGTRMHNLLAIHFGAKMPDIPLVNTELESEALMTFEKYKAFYPTEMFEVIDVERLFKVPLNICEICSGRGGYEDIYHEEEEIKCKFCSGDGQDLFTGKIDLAVRLKGVQPGSGQIQIIDHKTERRGGIDNSPQAWKHKSQVGRYQWAAEQIYKEPIYNICIDIITRQSPAGKKPPDFHRLITHRTSWQQEESMATLREIVKQIKYMETLPGGELSPRFITHRKECQFCEYEHIHGEAGRDPTIIQLKYKPAEEYLT